MRWPTTSARATAPSRACVPAVRRRTSSQRFFQITLIGSLFLAVIALLPIIFGALTGMHNLSLGGTSIIILVGVALETVKQLESQMMMRHYKGFLD